MAKILIDDIRSTISPYNWKLVSEEYHNLDEPLEFICAEGHKVIAP